MAEGTCSQQSPAPVCPCGRIHATLWDLLGAWSLPCAGRGRLGSPSCGSWPSGTSGCPCQSLCHSFVLEALHTSSNFRKERCLKFNNNFTLKFFITGLCCRVQDQCRWGWIGCPFGFPDVARETVHYSDHPTDAQCCGSDVKCLKKAANEAHPIKAFLPFEHWVAEAIVLQRWNKTIIPSLIYVTFCPIFHPDNISAIPQTKKCRWRRNKFWFWKKNLFKNS